MEIKGLKTTQAKEILPQFLLDFQSSGYFVYIEEDGTWDLKERRPSDLKGYNDDDDDKSEEAVESKKHELNSGISADDVHAEQSQEEDEDDNQDNDDDDLDDISMILKEDGSTIFFIQFALANAFFSISEIPSGIITSNSSSLGT